MTTVSHASGSMHRLFVTLLSLPVTARCYSGAVFVPGTESYPEYSLKVSMRRWKTKREKTSPFSWLDRSNRPRQDAETRPRASTSSLSLSLSNSETINNQDYDVDALLASQQRPLAAVVLFKTFWK